MKLLKSRGNSRGSVDPEAAMYGAPADSTPSRPRRGIFDSFRKSSSNNNNNSSNNSSSSGNSNNTKSLDEDETMLLKKGSYSHSERTEPTDAMTFMSETLSVASEEISTALNKTFAIINPPSFSQPSGQEMQFVGGFQSPREDEGHFTNVTTINSRQMLNQASLDRLAAIETATNFSDPKNVQLRTQSLKIVEFHSSEPPSCDIEDHAQTEISAIDFSGQSEVTFDPDKYLMEAEARQNRMSDLPIELMQEDSKEEKEEVEVDMVAGVWAEGEVKESGGGEIQSLMSVTRHVFKGARTPARNEDYISDASSDDEEEDGAEEIKEVENLAAAPSPVHSVSSSGSSTSSDWGKTSFGTREASLLDAVFNPDEEAEDADNETVEDTDDDGSTVDLEGDDELGSTDGDGTVEGPSSPQSQGSSVILDEYDEIDGLAAFAGIFVNLVSCNFADLASNVLIDDEDEYSVADDENQAAVSNTNHPLPDRKPVADRVPTPPAPPPTTSFWSFFGGCS